MMKIKKILIYLVCALSVASTFTGCNAEPTTGINDSVLDVVSTKYCDLVLVTQNWVGALGEGYTIYADRNTGVCYLRFKEGITVLLDTEGKPIIWEGFDGERISVHRLRRHKRRMVLCQLWSMYIS